MARQLNPTSEPSLADSLDIAAGRLAGSRPDRRSSRISAVALGGGFIAFTLFCAAFVRTVELRHVGLGMLLIALYTVAFRTHFESSGGSAVPTEPVLVGMCLLLPIQAVPAALVVVFWLDVVVDRRRLRAIGHEFLVRSTAGWHAAGPVLVLWLFPIETPALAHWPVFLAALFAQFVFDALSAAFRCVGIGVSARRLLQPMSWTFAVDFLLAPLSLCIVIAANNDLIAVGILTTPVALVWMLSLDRRERVEAAVRLGEAVEAAREEARVDALTQLANRKGWEESVEAAQRRLDLYADATRVTVLLADLDELKLANDTYGHDVGDLLIQEMGAAMVEAFPSAAEAARVGGDEFAVLFVGSPGEYSPESIIKTARQALANRPPIRGCVLRGSFGVSECPPAPSITTAIRVADDAMYQEKRDRKISRLAAPQPGSSPTA